MRTYPEDKSDQKDLEKLNASRWMVDCLKMNPNYVYWGPYEDYMCGDGKGWDSRVISEDWEDFGPWSLDELNEVVNFYFEVSRASEQCASCDGSRLNEETKQIHDDWYSFDKEDWIPCGENRRYNNSAWHNHLTQLEVDALWDEKRLHSFKEKPTPGQVNEWNKTGMGHDAINQWICVKARAKDQGVYGLCEKCGGEGSIYTEPSAKLGLILWFIHPRKGCSRGVHIKEIKRETLPAVIEYLREAAKRNQNRFSKISSDLE